jgi:SAM-dependent methyltransferase
MLRAAAAKARGRARLGVHDLRDLPVLGAFDLVTCLDDGLNYLHDPPELVAAFAGIARNLAPDGLAVFDVNSLGALTAFFGSLAVVPGADRVLVWRGHGDVAESRGLFTATLESLRRGEDGSWTATSHEHVQRHHPASLVAAALTAAGLAVRRLAGMRADGSLTDGFDEAANTKALYVVARA